MISPRINVVFNTCDKIHSLMAKRERERVRERERENYLKYA